MKQIDIRPYGCTLYITTCRDEFASKRAEYTDDGETFDNASGVASDFLSGTVHIVGVFSSCASILAHELAHVVFKVLSTVGVAIEATNCEAFCYLLEDLMSECLPLLATTSVSPVLQAQAAEAVPDAAQNFACYLIDRCERETITEESVLSWLGKFASEPSYNPPTSPVASERDGLTQSALRALVAAGHVSQVKVDEAFRIAANTPGVAHPHATESQKVAAWMTDDERVISDSQKSTALKDGGASASSVKPYSIALGALPMPRIATVFAGKRLQKRLPSSSSRSACLFFGVRHATPSTTQKSSRLTLPRCLNRKRNHPTRLSTSAIGMSPK